jgi:hypothetical protein
MANRLGSAALLWALFAPALNVRPASAAPSQAPAAVGTITVNSTGSSNFFDGQISLTEAILIANGGTGPAGLNRVLNP